MKIIGHRGAAGLALENTLKSLELAVLLGVDAIELDVRKTADSQLVVVHDKDLSNISASNKQVRQLTLKQLQAITLNDGTSTVPTLQEALKIIGKTPVFIELKERNCLDILIKTLATFPNANITIASFKLDELVKLRKLQPTIAVYALERTNPFESIEFARQQKFTGIGLNFWLLNPLTYLLTKRYKLDMYVYTVNSKFIGKFIKIVYPKVAICTNHPEWFIKHAYTQHPSHQK